MDAERFDRLVVGLVKGTSRRRVVGGLVAGLTALLGPATAEESLAGNNRGNHHKPGKRNCKGSEKKCRGKCIQKSECCTDNDCDGDQVCQSRSCACPGGTKLCASGACVPSAGCCGNSECDECESCQNGACVSGCASGQHCQSGTCVCDGTSCSGCCDGDICLTETTAANCGRGGQDCFRCGANEACPAGVCVCDAQSRRCNGICISAGSCCGDDDCHSPARPFCENGACVCGGRGDHCATGVGCCSGVCSCDGGKLNNPETNQCHADAFSQTFRNNLSGWYDWDDAGDTWPGGRTTLQLTNGHAVLVPGNAGSGDLTPSTLWGGYSAVFPTGGYTTEIDIFLDPANAPINTQFHYSSAINGTDCAYFDEEFFHGGTDGSGTYCVSVGGGTGTAPCDGAEAQAPVEIEDAGWYTFRHEFRAVGGNLQITLSLLRGNDPVGSWTLSRTGGSLGGNRYGWFPVNQFAALAIRNSRRTSA